MANRGKILVAVAAIVAACLLMAASLYGVWLFTDEGRDIVSMRIVTTGMLLFNQMLIVVMVLWLIVRRSP